MDTGFYSADVVVASYLAKLSTDELAAEFDKRTGELTRLRERVKELEEQLDARG